MQKSVKREVGLCKKCAAKPKRAKINRCGDDDKYLARRRQISEEIKVSIYGDENK